MAKLAEQNKKPKVLAEAGGQQARPPRQQQLQEEGGQQGRPQRPQRQPQLREGGGGGRGFTAPKWQKQTSRQKQDAYLESQGLLNYQTAGMSQQEIADRYAQAGVRVQSDWFAKNYGGGAMPQPSVGWDRGGQENLVPGEFTQAIDQGTPFKYPAPSVLGTPENPTPKIAYDFSEGGLLVKVKPHSAGTEASFRVAPRLPEPVKKPYVSAKNEDIQGGKANWTDMSVDERKKILQDPNFYKENKIIQYPQFVQQQILADPNIDWKQLPKWQRAYFEVSSRPAAMGAVQGAILGIANPMGGALAGAVIGVVAGAVGYDPMKEAWQQGDNKFTWDVQQLKDVGKGAFGYLNLLAEYAEKSMGTVATAAHQAIAHKENPLESFNKDTFNANMSFFETVAPAVQEALKDFNTPIVGSDKRLSWDDAVRLLVPSLSILGKLEDVIVHPEKYKGEEKYLGAAMPVPLEKDWTERLDKARQEVAAGRNYREVAVEFQQGILGQIGDMVGQGVFDPLNVMPKIETKVGETAAGITGHKVAAESFRGSEGIMEAGRKYKTLVQTGMAQTIDPNFKLDNMGWMARQVAGLTDTGEIKAGMFTNKGLLDPTPSKNFVQELTTLTPEARASIGANMFYENIGTLMETIGDPTDAIKYTQAIADGDMRTWEELGTKFANAPEFYTILPALKAFDVEKLGDIAASWEMAAVNRDALTRIADVLGQEPGKLLDDLAKRGTKQQDFARIVERARQSNSPQAKALLGEIEAGRFTADTVGEIVDVFHGEGAIPWHPGQWKASMLDELGTHFDQWAVKNFNLKPDSAFFRTAHMLKAAQSLLLLGANPGYALTNGMSNILHRAASGIFGYMTSNQINGWMDKFGVVPARLHEGFGLGGDMNMQASDKTPVRTEAVRAAKTETSGALAGIQRTLGKIGNAMPFTKLSAWFEKSEGQQGYVIAMKQFWGQSWRRGVGFEAMKPELISALQDAGMDPGIIYGAIEAGMNQADVERAVFGRYQGQQARSLVHDAAQNLGISSTDAAGMLEKIGVLDHLDNNLKGADTRDKIFEAFKRARQTAQDEIDATAARDMVARAEHISQRLDTEGAKALADIVTDMEMQGIEKWMQHYERMGEAADAMESLDPATRRNLWDVKYQESNVEFRRYNAQRGSTYLGIVKAIGLENNPNARGWLEAMASTDKVMDGAYQFMREQRNGHFEKWRDDWGNPDQYNERDTIEAKIDKRFKAAMKQEEANTTKMADLLGKQYEALFGLEEGEAARQAYEKIGAFRKEMVDRQQKFRDMQKEARAEGVLLELRQQAARKFWGETYQYMILEMGRIKQEAITTLDDIAKRKGTPAPTEPAPGQPPSPTRQAVEPTDESRAQLKRDIQARAKAKADATSAIWDVAEQYWAKGANFSRSNFGDKNHLLNALQKPEYGGIPDILKFDDPRITPDFVRGVMESRKVIKDAEAAAATPRLIKAADAKTGKVVKIGDNTNLLKAVAELGGISRELAKDIAGDANPKTMPGVFTKQGINPDMMAVRLVEYGYPIDLNSPDDIGGVAQTKELIRRAISGDRILPTHANLDAEIEARAAVEAVRAAEIEQAQAAEVPAFNATEFYDSLKAATDAEKLNIIGDMPDNVDQTIKDFAAREWDDAVTRISKEAQDQAIAENMTRAEMAVEAQAKAADFAMTRKILQEKYTDAFPAATAEQIGAWMKVSDAVLETLGKITGETKDQMYTLYKDVIRGDEGTLAQDWMAARMDTAQVEGYARALVRSGADELRRAVQNEPSKADRVNLLNEVYKLDPAMAKKVAGQVKNMLYQDNSWITARLNPDQVEGYARALVRAGEGELRSAIQNEPNRTDRINLLNAVYQLDPNLAKTVAKQVQNMLYQADAGAKGGTEFIDGKAIMYAWEGGDISTIIHENGHIFLEMMNDAAKRSGNVGLIEDLAAFNDWARLEQTGGEGNVWTAVNGNGFHSITKMEDGSWGYKQPSGATRLFDTFETAQYVQRQEMFARGWEKYLADGTAPTPKLKSLFAKFKVWLLEIYKTITGSVIDINLTDEMRQVFDKMLGQTEFDRIKADQARVKALQQQAQARPSLFTEWNKAQPGDMVANGTRLVEKGITNKTRAKAQAKDIGGDVVLDGFNKWGVVKNVEPVKEAPIFETPEPIPPADSYQRTITSKTVDVKRLSDPDYFVQAYESTFAGPGTDEALYKTLTKKLVPSGKEPSSYLADLYDQAKAPKPQPAPEADAIRSAISADYKNSRPRSDAIGYISGGKVGTLENAGYRIALGEMTKANETKIQGLLSGNYANRLRENGLTIVESTDYADYVMRQQQPENVQESFIDTRPEFGQKMADNLVKVKSGLRYSPKLGDKVELNGERYVVGYVNGGEASPTGLIKLQFENDPYHHNQKTVHVDEVKLVEEVQPPTVDVTPEANREKHLLNALVSKIEAKDWFAKSKDFEGFISTLGFDLNKEADLNLAYDIMEGAYNMQARKVRADLDTRGAGLQERIEAVDLLETNLTEARRTLGKMKLQQFSTPITISEAAGWAADVHPGDIVGEPTAGTANLVDRFYGRDDITVKVNEIDEGRRQVLELIGYKPEALDLMSGEWVIQDGKKAGPWADVVISNPPWGSYSTGKYGKATNVPVKLNDWSQRFTYLTLARLPEDGRFVGVMPANWLYTMDRTTRAITNKPSEFYKWLKKTYTVQAVVESLPGAYKQRGTDVSSLLVVIDKTPHVLDTPTIERYGADQPKTMADYVQAVESIPKRTEKGIAHVHEQATTANAPAGPDASGIIDPAAVRGLESGTPERIGQPTEKPVKRGGGRTKQPDRVGSEPDRPAAEPNPTDVTEPTTEAGNIPTDLVGRQPAELPPSNERRTYSDAFTARIIAGKEAVKNSGSFTEYVGRAPLQDADLVHPHPNTVVETKGLAGVPYPKLEEEFRPSPSVMAAMNNRTLSYEGNIDPVWAAIQQNDKHKMGMLVADDVGMGKSRTGAAFVIDRIEKGKKRILVVTKDEQNVLNLMNQEFSQVYKGIADENGRYTNERETDFPAKRIFLQGKSFLDVKAGKEAIPTFPNEPVVYFVTSTEFANFAPAIKALHADAVVVDEAHLFKNVGSTARGVAWADVHKDWIQNNASMLYLTATPGIDLGDLRYLYGLKVWSMDGFDDWIKVITGQESPESMKTKQTARNNIDSWVEKVQAAKEQIDFHDATITDRYNDTHEGIQVGQIGLFKSTERYNQGRYQFVVDKSIFSYDITNETEAIIVADLVGKRIDALPAKLSTSDFYNLFGDAQSAFRETFNPPDRSDIKTVGMKDSSDILSKAENGKWGKQGLGAFEATLPPAHTEQIMRELKVAGAYMARDISRAGVEFGVKEYKPAAKAKADFNKRVQIYRRMYDAWARFGKMNEGAKKAAALFGINGDIQVDAKRALFNMRLPGIIDEAKAAIARGEQPVISLVSVGEVDGESGSLVSGISKINTQKVEKIGKDSYSDPTEIPEALLEINDIKDELKSLGTLASPIDVLRDAFGDRIAFVTGATPTKERMQAQADFQANKIDLIVISGAGKTGINLHDVTGKKRIHLIVGDYEWSATNFKQELGRVDRTGQRSSPIVTVMHTGSAGERKFIATISNRMKGLGATSKGGAESTGTGAMTDAFELGSTMDKIALNAAWQDFPQEWKAAFLDKYFRDLNVPEVPRSQLDTTSQALSKFLLGLQAIDLETGEKIMEAYIQKRVELLAAGSELDDTAERNTAAQTGSITRQVELADNLRMSEVRAADNSKYAILDGVLTPHMNAVKGLVTAGADVAERYLMGGNAWMRWVQFYDETKGQYATGLRVKSSRIKDVAEHFGQILGSGHKPETALVDLQAGDRIKLSGADMSEWELYLGRGGAREDKIVIDQARLKHKETLMGNGAQYNAIGGFFFVEPDKLNAFLKRFPIRQDEAPAPRLHQDAPILPKADPRMPLGGYEEAAQFLPHSEVADQGFSQHVRPMLDEMQKVALKRLDSKTPAGAARDMTPEGQDLLRKYMAQTQGNMASTKLATIRWGENQRDFAMLNYKKRYGFDKFLDVVYPYQFFYTRSLMGWAARALDKPSWYANYARLKRQQDRYERDIPERLRGKFKISAPWMPSWMGGSMYIDPITNLFTPASFLRPFERMMQTDNYQQIEAERILQEWAADGKVSESEIVKAVKTKSGATWERAFTEAKIRRESEINNPMDFMNTVLGPAWYLTTPYKMATGQGKTVAELPITRTANAIDTVTQGTWAEPIGKMIGMVGKPEAWARKKLGLPEFGEYGDYYVDRQLANMVADGVLTPDQAQTAMMERTGAIFDQARERVKYEMAMRVPISAALMAGLTADNFTQGIARAAATAPASAFGSGLLPSGELEYRGLKQEWNEAWKRKDGGDDKAITKFFEDHPEYEAYLAKGKTPDERIRGFLVGKIWDGYMALGPTDKKQFSAEAGDTFKQSFLDTETRSYDTLQVDQLAQWAQMLKQPVPATPATAATLAAPPASVPMIPADVTAITDKYFTDRTAKFPNYYAAQQQYYNIPYTDKSGRLAFLRKNPEYDEYRKWQQAYYKKYPDLVPVFNGKVFKRIDTSSWPPALEDYVTLYAYTGDKLPKGAMSALTQVWIMEGKPYGDVQSWLDSDVAPALMYGNQNQ
jgi:hypothetical protein